MRRLISMLSFLAILAAQTSFAACPTSSAAEHEESVSATSHHEHHADVATPSTDADLGATEQQPHDGSCTALTRCHWNAVPSPAAGWSQLRPAAFARTGQFVSAPSTTELAATTPPPRAIS